MFAIILPRLETTPRAREAFTVVFYGIGEFFGMSKLRKSASTRRANQRPLSDCPLKSTTAQRCEKQCKIR